MAIITSQTKIFESRLEELARLRSFIAQTVAEHAPSSLFWLQLASQEAFCNIIRHSYQKEAKLPVRVRCDTTDVGITIALEDSGNNAIKALPIATARNPWSQSGRGLLLIRAAVDTVTYVPKQDPLGLNCLTLFKTYNHVGG